MNTVDSRSVGSRVTIEKAKLWRQSITLPISKEQRLLPVSKPIISLIHMEGTYPTPLL